MNLQARSPRSPRGESVDSPTVSGSAWVASPSFGELHVLNDGRITAIEISVHVHEQLGHIKATGVGDIIVDRDVLVAYDPQANVTVSITGTGDAYLPPAQPLHVNSLSLQSRGIGDTHLVGSEVVANVVELVASSVGDLDFHATNMVVNGPIIVTVSGRGNVAMSASTLRASKLSVKVTGVGHAIVAATGTSSSSSLIAQCNYTLSGVGLIKAGFVVCTNAVVKNSGVSDATVQVTNSLEYSMTSFGNIYYAGSPPATLEQLPGSHDRAVKSTTHFDLPSEVSWAHHYTLPPDSFVDAPQKYPVEQTAPLEQPQDVIHQEPAGPDVTEPKSHPSTDTSPWPHRFLWHLVGFTVLVVVVFMGERIYSRRHHAQQSSERAPLVGEGTTVYI